MFLTLEQKQTLKTWLLANAQALNDSEAAAALNVLASPAFHVYRTNVPVEEIMLNGFDWTRVDNLAVGKARIWEWMTGVDGNIDPSKSNIRDGINETWKGTAADLAVRDAVYLHCFRQATIAEKLLVTSGAGTAPVAGGNGSGPATMGAEGLVTTQNVIDAYNS